MSRLKSELKKTTKKLDEEENVKAGAGKMHFVNQSQLMESIRSPLA